MIDTTGEPKQSADEESKSFTIIEPSESSIAGGASQAKSLSSQYSGLNAALNGKRKGKTRAEAFRALQIEQVELLDTGELKLPNGKIIGHRDYKHIYRQRNRLPDEREAVVINKLALEYRQMQHGGAIAKVPGGDLAKKEDPLEKGLKQAKDRTRDKTAKRDQKERMQVGVKANKLMFHFRLQYNAFSS